ncbi:tyrosine-type recombinase/integrase [Vibrio coralliirubri]|uniref:tyrosine-type recombinase/integrase n=1 Tax=Vibrio coralliirubri TaxID=1516159 RepID=UPI0012E019A9|nr:site-specific integrase [Vibrio coralliirubri]
MKWPKILVRKMTIKTKVRGTKKALKTKVQKKRVIKRNPSISLDKFDYPLNAVAQSVCHFIRTRTVAETTLPAMKSHARHVIKHMGYIDISKLTKQRVEEFKIEMLESGVRGKVINSCYTVLRAICDTATTDGLLANNPMEKIHNMKLVEAMPKPLSEEEFKTLIETDSDWVMAKLMTVFGGLTALRISELLCVTWENVTYHVDDQGNEKANLYIDLAKPMHRYKITKTPESNREIEVSVEGTLILRKMEKLTGHLKPVSIGVVQRDNITVQSEKCSFIFYNDQTGQPWLHPKQFSKQFFDDFLASAGVEHRGPSQLRHTCASLHYNNGVAVAWIAKLLGHRNVSIVEKHYAKFNTKSLKREQIKADKNIKQLFTQTDKNSIVVEREELKPQPKSISTPSLESLMSLLKMAKTDEQRDTIFAVIDIAIAEGGYQ